MDYTIMKEEWSEVLSVIEKMISAVYENDVKPQSGEESNRMIHEKYYREYWTKT